MNNTVTNKTGIFAVLLAITVLQVGLSYAGFLAPVGHVVAALLLGASETLLVAIFFMGLKNEARLIRVTAVFPFVLFCIMNAALILDVLIFSK